MRSARSTCVTLRVSRSSEVLLSCSLSLCHRLRYSSWWRCFGSASKLRLCDFAIDKCGIGVAFYK